LSNARCERLSTYNILPSHYLVYSCPCTDPCEIMKKERNHVRKVEIPRRHYFHCEETSRKVLCIKWAAAEFHVPMHGWKCTVEKTQGRKTSCLEDSLACICIKYTTRSQLHAEDKQI
jgi:hypothetical protein